MRQSISPARRTGRNAALSVELDIGRQIRGPDDGVPNVFAGLHGKLLDGRVQLAEVIDTGGGLGFGTRLQQIGDNNRAQQGDDRDDNHDFDEREPA